MNSFIGTYECKADAKGRLMIPVALKTQLSPLLEEGFVLKRAVFQSCLELYPMSEWKVLMEKMNGLNRFSKKNNDFIRRFTAGVKVVEVDAAGDYLFRKSCVCSLELIKNWCCLQQSTLLKYGINSDMSKL